MTADVQRLGLLAKRAIEENERNEALGLEPTEKSYAHRALFRTAATAEAVAALADEASRASQLEGLLKRAYFWVRDAASSGARNGAQALLPLIVAAIPHPDPRVHAAPGDGMTRCGLHLIQTFPLPRTALTPDDVTCVACIQAHVVEMERLVQQYTALAADSRLRIEILETPLSDASVDAITKDEP